VAGQDVVEREIDRTELYVADEAFFCGSGYEVTPIVSIDRFPLGDGRVGPLPRRLASAYMDLVRGVDRSHPEWRTAVYGKKSAMAEAVAQRRNEADVLPALQSR